jgi:hypothetical protein
MACAWRRWGRTRRGGITSIASRLRARAGEFISLTPAACDWIVRAIEWSRRQRRTEMRGAIASREARRERRMDRGMDDILDDAVPAFHGKAFVVSA